MIILYRPRHVMVFAFAMFVITQQSPALASDREGCNSLLLSEAERMEEAFRETVNSNNSKLEQLFVEHNFQGDKEKMLISKGTFIAFFNKKYKEAIMKLQSAPVAYRKISQNDSYPKACDSLDKLKKISNVAISEHDDIWGMAIDDAQVFIDELDESN